MYRRPPGDGLPGPRERREEGIPGKGGVSRISGGISLPGMFSCPIFYVFICMDFYLYGRCFFPGMENYRPGGIFFASPFFWLSGRALDSVIPRPWFEPHVSSLFFVFFIVPRVGFSMTFFSF